MWKIRTRSVFVALALSGIAVGVFMFSVHIRKPWAGEILDYTHQTSTSRTTTFLSNWHHDGFFNLRGIQVQSPPSIEYAQEGYRSYYSTWPAAGFWIQYGVLCLLGLSPDYDTVTCLGLADHLICVLLAMCLVYRYAYRLLNNSLQAFIWSFPVPILLLFLPGPMLVYQNLVYGAQLIIMEMLALALLDSEIQAKKHAGKSFGMMMWGERVLLFFMTITHWLAGFVIIVLYLQMLVRGDMGTTMKQWIKKSILYGIPVLLALCLYASQLLWVNGFKTVGSRAELYSTLPGNFSKIFWGKHVANAYGKPAAWLIPACAILLIILYIERIISRKRRMTLWNDPRTALISTLVLLLWPTLMLIYALPALVYIHGFTSIYLISFVSVGPLSLIPLLLLTRRNSTAHYCSKKCIAPLTLCILAFVYVFFVTEGPFSLLGKTVPYYRQMGLFLKNNTSYQDVLVSPVLGESGMDPRLMGYAGKVIHPVRTLTDLEKIVKGIDGDYSVVFCQFNEKDMKWGDPVLEEMPQYAQERVEGTLCSLVRVPKQVYETMSDWALADEEQTVLTMPIKPLDVFALGRLHALACQYSDDPAMQTRMNEIDTMINLKRPRLPNPVLNDAVSLIAAEALRISYDRFALRFLLYVKQPIDENWKMALLSEIDPAQKDRLQPADRKERFLYWNFLPAIPTTKWKHGTYITVSTSVETVPATYQMRLGMFDNLRGDFGKCTYAANINFEALPYIKRFLETSSSADEKGGV